MPRIGTRPLTVSAAWGTPFHARPGANAAPLAARGRGTTGSHVPHESQDHARATSMPDTARPVNRVAVGTGLRLCGFDPPPAQIPACGTTALGSWLGYGRRIARQARDAGSGPAGATAAQRGAFPPSPGWCAGCGAEALDTSAASSDRGRSSPPRCCRARRSS